MTEWAGGAPIPHPATPPPVPTLVTIGSLAEADRFPRRVPVPALRPPLDWCKPTGVSLDANSRVIVMPDQAGASTPLIDQLQQRGVTVLPLDDALTSDALEMRVKSWLADGPIHGVYWLAALDVEAGLEEIELATWRELNRVRVKNLYRVMRALGESAAFLVSATRLGGLHGYGPQPASAPLGGGVTGFTKAYKRERAQAVVKAVDFSIEASGEAIAQALLGEALFDPGVVEVGYWDDERFAITLIEQSARDGQPGLQLTRDSIFLITGAAGGITSAIVADLAAHSGGTFYLLDLAPLPETSDPHVQLFRADKDALKQRLIEEAKALGERPTPVAIEKKLAAIERAEAALRAVESVRAAGGMAHYYSVNLLDGPGLTRVVDEIRWRHGRIDVLVHAGGIEISRALADKDPAQFDRVYDVKADGFFSLLRAAKEMPISATVAFSSVAGRFGNAGQTDYSAANDLLCKLTSSLQLWRPGTRSLVIDWTAWGGIGMATRGSIPKIMEMAGIEVLPPEVGVPTVRRELTYGGARGEVVIASKLGVMLNEFDSTGGLDPQKAANHEWLMAGQVTACQLHGGLKAEVTLDPREQPFLGDHVLDGTPLLPGVMGTEAFAQLASALAPSYRVAAVENERFESPFKFYRMQPRTLHLSATLHPMRQGELIAHATLRSITPAPKPDLPAQEKIHFSADVRLTRLPVASAALRPAPELNGTTVEREAIYRLYFHGPAYQVLDRVTVAGNRAMGVLAANLPPDTTPNDAVLLMQPRLIELCLQTAGVWQIQMHGAMALPLAIGSVSTYRPPQGQAAFAVVEAMEDGAYFNAHVIDEAGNVVVELNGYRTVQLPGDACFQGTASGTDDR